jgi:trans-2,3-dihydro-3-hydroxyanthranilate isomerase
MGQKPNIANYVMNSMIATDVPSGLTEDPATGSATVAAAALLADLSGEREGELKLRVGQGVDMGRPSLLLTRVRKENGAVVSAHVGGRCIQMMEGTFRLAGD